MRLAKNIKDWEMMLTVTYKDGNANTTKFFERR